MMRHRIRPLVAVSSLVLILLIACGRVPGDKSAPEAPSQVHSTAGLEEISVNWQDNSADEQGFRVYRVEIASGASDGQGTEVGVVGENETNFTDDEVTVGTLYTYSVASFRGLQESARTSQDNPPVSPHGATLSISVTKTGDGDGVVTSDPVGIDCGSVCAHEFEAVTAVVLTASPSQGSRFDGWTGSCSGPSTTCVVESGSTGDVVANFTELAEPPAGQHSLSVQTSGTGSGQVTSDPPGISCPEGDCTGNFAEGSTVTLTATTEAGSEFVGWSGDCMGSDTSCEIVMLAVRSVIAAFDDTGDNGDNDDDELAIVVTTGSGGTGGDECSLRDAITAANTDSTVAGCAAGDGADVIQLPASETISLTEIDNETAGPNGLPSITSDITVEGADAVIEREATDTQFRIFHVSQAGALALNDVTVRGGHGGEFGGGGIYVDQGELDLSGVTLERNLVSGEALGSALLNDAGNVEVRNSTLQGNADPEEPSGDDLLGPHGGAIASIDGRLGVFGSLITLNGPQGWDVPGATLGLFGEGSVAEIEDSTISENSGMAILNEGVLTATDVVMTSNWNEATGGVRNLGEASFLNVEISGNNTEQDPALDNRGIAELTRSKVVDNAGLFGGMGVSNTGTLEIVGTEITGNTSGEFGSGGGIANFNQMSISGSVVKGNSGFEGGGVYNEGTLLVVDSEVDGNEAFDVGGGIYSSGMLEIDDALIGGEMGNLAATDGGGIYVPSGFDGAVVSLTGGSSVLNNEAGRNGGGIYATSDVALTLCGSCSISGNLAGAASAGTGGGLYTFGITTTSFYGPGIHDNSPDEVAPGGTVDVLVSASSDDAEESVSPLTNPSTPAGSVYTDSEDLEFTFDDAAGMGTDQVVGVRFASVEVPPSAIILDARIVFTASEVDEGATELQISMEANDDPASFTPSQGSFEISGRETIGAVDWSPEAWMSVDESGPRQATPSLNSVVEDMVTGSGWASGNAMVFVVQGQSTQESGATRTAYAFDGDPSKAPRLVIHYLMPN